MTSPAIDFLIIGAAKCATTSFHQYLSQHPDIYMPIDYGINHETGYFLTPGNEAIKRLTNDMIRKDACRIFQDYKGERVVGERSTDYSKYPFRTVDFNKIKSHNPQMKFLYFVGNPLPRLKKLYLHHLRRNPANTDEDFQTELEKNELYYRQVCSYYLQAKRYVDFFGLEKIKIIDIDKLDTHIGEVLSGIFQFLNVRDIPLQITNRRFNVNDIERNERELKIPTHMERTLLEDFLKLTALASESGKYK